MGLAQSHLAKVVAIAIHAAVCASLACGGAPSPGASSAAGSGGEGGSRCLAAAEAKHPRKPGEPFRVTAKHVLVRYVGARGAPETVTRTREQACLRAQEALAKLKGGMSFADAVGQYSDAPGAARDGSVGSVVRSDVAPPFADAAFELENGEVSDVVESPFGFHVILRVE